MVISGINEQQPTGKTFSIRTCGRVRKLNFGRTGNELHGSFSKDPAKYIERSGVKDGSSDLSQVGTRRLDIYTTASTSHYKRNVPQKAARPLISQ